MTKFSNDDASERLRKLWQAYEYPGQMVLRDFARLKKWFRSVYAVASGRNQRSPSEEERENHLWAERRD